VVAVRAPDPRRTRGTTRALIGGMDALKLLESQHDEVDALVADIEDASSPTQKADLFVKLADNLAAHAKIEETLFYPAVIAKQTEDILLESVEEHLSIKRVLADLLELDPDDDEFDAKLSVMKEQLEHHAHEEEEGELFPKVKKLLDAEEREALGQEMLARFEELMGEAPRTSVPAEIDKAARLA